MAIRMKRSKMEERGLEELRAQHEDVEDHRIDGDHQQSFAFIAGSLLLPHLEPYLIRSMKAAERHVTDPKVLDGLKRFSAQEG